MKLTITVTGSQGRIEKTISVRALVGMTVLSSLFMLVSSRSTDSQSEDIARVQHAHMQLEHTQYEVESLKTETGAKLEALAKRIAELSVQARRLDKQGKSIAQELGMTAIDLDAFMPEISTHPVEQDPLIAQISEVQKSLDVKKRQLTMLESLVRGHHISEQSQLSGRPVNSGWLSSYYGMRADPFTGQPAMHKGIDFAGDAGADVVATAAGIVTWAGERYGYGQLVEIEHGDGFTTRYGHNETLNVSVGDVVTRGQVIAKMGSTGRSTGPHVHYEVMRNGQHVDPLPFVYKR